MPARIPCSSWIWHASWASRSLPCRHPIPSTRLPAPKDWTGKTMPRYPGCGRSGWVWSLDTAMNKAESGMWYYEYLDQIVNLELKNKPAQQGGTQLRYRAARERQGDVPLCGQIAQALLPRLADSTVILVTGTGNPEWLPHGE